MRPRQHESVSVIAAPGATGVLPDGDCAEIFGGALEFTVTFFGSDTSSPCNRNVTSAESRPFPMTRGVTVGLTKGSIA
jgi:hypothetical protein